MHTMSLLLGIVASLASIQRSTEASQKLDRKAALVTDGLTATTSLAMSFYR